MWLTISETADYLKVSKETIYKLAQQNEIPSSKVGSQWRFNRKMLDQWLMPSFIDKKVKTNSEKEKVNG